MTALTTNRGHTLNSIFLLFRYVFHDLAIITVVCVLYAWSAKAPTESMLVAAGIGLFTVVGVFIYESRLEKTLDYDTWCSILGENSFICKFFGQHGLNILITALLVSIILCLTGVYPDKIDDAKLVIIISSISFYLSSKCIVELREALKKLTTADTNA